MCEEFSSDVSDSAEYSDFDSSDSFDDMSDVGFDDIDVSDDSFEMEDVSDDVGSDFADDVSDVEFDDADIDLSDCSFEMEDISDDVESDFSDDMDDIIFDNLDSETLDNSFEMEDISDDVGTDFVDDIDEDEFDDSDIDISEDSFELDDISDDIESNFSDDMDDIIFDNLDSETLVNSFEMEDISDDVGTDSADDLDEDEFDDSDIDISEESLEMEDIIIEGESLSFEDDDKIPGLNENFGEMMDATETQDSNINSEIDSMEFDDEAEAMDMAEEFEDIDASNSDDIAEDFETMDLGDAVEGKDIDTPDSIENMELINPDETEFTTPEEPEFIATEGPEIYHDEPEFISPDSSEFETGDIHTYIDADETTEASEAIDWDNMLSDGDRDYINGVVNNDNYTQEQKDFFVNQYLSEVYERETTEPEYGARVKGLTYDGRDIITKPPESFDELSVDESLADEVICNDNLSIENLSNLRDYLEDVSTDESLTNDEKSYLINEALGVASDIDNNLGFDFETNSEFLEEPIESVEENLVNEYNEPFSGELSEQDINDIYEGLDEYDFNGIDFFEDVNRLDSSLESFSAENWEQLSIEEQKEKMEDLASYIIDVTGLKNPPQIVFYNNEETGDYGGFNRSTNTLSINEHMLYQNDEAADTVAHELWHAYQYQRAKNPQTKLDYMYLENFNDYITPEDFDGYQSQLIESEARAFAQQIKDRLNSF